MSSKYRDRITLYYNRHGKKDIFVICVCYRIAVKFKPFFAFGSYVFELLLFTFVSQSINCDFNIKLCTFFDLVSHILTINVN